MRLVRVEDLTIEEFRGDCKQPYAIASHRWSEQETTYQDFKDQRNTECDGYRKVEAFAAYVKKNMPTIEWLWIDTCCINRESSAELSESINSMFRWYQQAEICIAYLVDHKTGQATQSLVNSEWFRRGWTLQELLAPQLVIFVTETWDMIGHKGDAVSAEYPKSIGPNLESTLTRATNLPQSVLRDFLRSANFSTEDKMKWIEGRKTTLPEDMSYALYGILNLNLGSNYGEGAESARSRLEIATSQRDNGNMQQAEHFRKISAWLSPPDPWTNHQAARLRHEPGTGVWLLRDERYLAWKAGTYKLLWIHGKAGCGKTVLSSTAIEDIMLHCKDSEQIGQAIFYLTFSDNRKQTFADLLVSLVAQLGWKGSGLTMLCQSYSKPGRKPDTRELGAILLSSISSYNEVFLHIDALDECPEGDNIRQNMLSELEQLLNAASNVRMLVTSRDVNDIRHAMELYGGEALPIVNKIVDTDIQRYIETELSNDHEFARMEVKIQTIIRDTLSQKADGMFRWVYCQLQELKNCRSLRPSAIKAALSNLPPTLDETYERMLSRISAHDRSLALTLLRWLAYAKTPPRLAELAEAGIIDPTDDVTADGVIDIEDRGAMEDTLHILAGFVVPEGGDVEARLGYYAGNLDVANLDIAATAARKIKGDTRIRLAHFSVKEYLESDRILESTAKAYHLDPGREHHFLTQSCLVYLFHYSGSSQKTLSKPDLLAFPLLEYAAKTWFYHARLQQPSSTARELRLLSSELCKRDWLKLHDLEERWRPPFQYTELRDYSGPALCYSSLLGLGAVVRQLLSQHADVNAEGGYYGNALQAASYGGYEKIVEMLLVGGADINAQGGYYGNALQAASVEGYEKIVEILLVGGADVNAQGGHYSNALRAASYGGYEKIVEILLVGGANINAQGGYYGDALQAASYRGNEKIVEILLVGGADINAQGGYYGNALQAASVEGREKIVEILLVGGADINAQGGYYGNALQAASFGGYEKIVEMLLVGGANVNAQGGNYGNALQAASFEGREKIVEMLLDKGATDLDGALQEALTSVTSDRRLEERKKTAELLLTRGAKPTRAKYSDVIREWGLERYLDADEDWPSDEETDGDDTSDSEL